MFKSNEVKIKLLICVFLHLLNLISREKFEPEPGFELGPLEVVNVQRRKL